MSRRQPGEGLITAKKGGETEVDFKNGFDGKGKPFATRRSAEVEKLARHREKVRLAWDRIKVWAKSCSIGEKRTKIPKSQKKPLKNASNKRRISKTREKKAGFRLS